MDRNFYNQHRSYEIQREISRELATRHMLDGIKREPLTMKQAKNLVLRLAPVTVVITVLFLLGLFG